MTKANIAIYIATIRQALHLEPCSEEEMQTNVNQIAENLATDWYRWWIRSLYFDGPWVCNLDLVYLNEQLRDNIGHNGLTPIKQMLSIFQTNNQCGPIHAAFQMFVWIDKWKLVHNQRNETFDITACPTIQAGKPHHYCTCEPEQRTFMAIEPNLPEHPNPHNIKRLSTLIKDFQPCPAW